MKDIAGWGERYATLEYPDAMSGDAIYSDVSKKLGIPLNIISGVGITPAGTGYRASNSLEEIITTAQIETGLISDPNATSSNKYTTGADALKKGFDWITNLNLPSGNPTRPSSWNSNEGTWDEYMENWTAFNPTDTTTGMNPGINDDAWLQSLLKSSDIEYQQNLETAKDNAREETAKKFQEGLDALEKLGIDIDNNVTKAEESAAKNKDYLLGGDNKETRDNFWVTAGADLTERGEALTFQDIINNPEQFLERLDGENAKLTFTNPTTGLQQLNPWVATAIDFANSQAGFISKEQIALIENSALIELANLEKESQLALLEEEGANETEILGLQIEADKAIAQIAESNRIREFNYLNKKEDYQFQLQQRAQEREFELLIKQGEQSSKASDREHAELMKQFQIQQEQNLQQFDLQTQQFDLQSQQFENQQLQQQQQFELEQQAALDALALQTKTINRQVERDKITDETNRYIAEVQRLGLIDTVEGERLIAEAQAARDIRLAELQKNTITTQGAQQLQAELAGTEADITIADTQAGAVTGAAAVQAEAASPFGYLGASIDSADRTQRLADAQAILGEQFNPYALTNEQFKGMQDTAAQAGATPFGALSTAPEARYQDILGLQEAQAAAGPFQAAQLGQTIGDIGTILRSGLTPTEQVALARAPGNPFGLTAQQQIDLQGTLARGGLTAEQQSSLMGLQARGGITKEDEFMALQNSLARGGLTPNQRLAEVQASAAPQNMANYLNFIGNPAAVGFAGQSGFLQNIADSPEGNIPASLFGLNVPQNTSAVPVNPTLSDLTDLSDEQLGFYQGQQAAQNYLTPSQIFQQAQTVTPQGV
jgi:hypothetical protein